ncbi:MAG: metal-binding protein [Synechocystis sp.]
MPDGKTHDKITLWLIPLVLGGSFWTTRSERLTLLTAIAFGFSGLMFGPDLDIHSRQYQRWGWLRWLWLPYRKLLRHRSPWSHGFLIGTVVRLLYVGLWGMGLGLLILGGVWLWQRGQVSLLPPTPTGSGLLAWGRRYQGELLASFIGLELGAMSHSLCDWGGSWLKKQRGKRRSPSKATLRRQRSGRRR